jgi:hypothetical protein
MKRSTPKKLRSQLWFDDASEPGMTALYLERYLNYGLSREELQSGRSLASLKPAATWCRVTAITWRWLLA